MERSAGKQGNLGWQPRLVDGIRLKYLGIVEALADDVRSGLLPVGAKLPPQRAVAQALEVDLTTVTKAFNEARRRGLIIATVGRGTFIAPQAESAETAPDHGTRPVDLSMNIPPQPEAAAFARRLPEAMAHVLSPARSGSALLAYQESGGSANDRSSAARWLGARLGSLDPERIVITAGSQNALFALCLGLMERGAVIAAPALTYPGLQSVAQRCGLRLYPLAMDEDGILPDAFADLCSASPPAALYLVPTIDNPTTATLPLSRRQEIAAIARRFQVPVIEDDPYGMLPQLAPPPVATFAPDLTYHIATVSKCVSPALRLAFVVTPEATAAARLAGVLRASNLMTSPLMAAVVSHWIDTGTLESITTTIRGENVARQAIAAEALQGQAYRFHEEGHHLWLHLPEGWKAMDFAYQAERSGLSVVPAAAFALSAPPYEAVRISLGPPADRLILRRALDATVALLRRAPQQGRILV